MADRSQPISVRLPADLFERVDAAAAADARTRTSLIVKALNVYLDEVEHAAASTSTGAAA